MENKASIPLLFPFEPSEFWIQIRKIVKEEITNAQRLTSHTPSLTLLPGMTQKPLYKIAEICTLFNISKPTVYEWVKEGKLRRVKIRSRVYFLGNDIQQLLQL